MAKQPIQFTLPIKGVVKSLSFSDHSPDSSIDALNVLPFGTDGRMRIGQRSGTSKLWAATLGSNPLQGLWETTLALDPTTVVASTLLATDPFTYANGNLSVVAPNWDTRTNAGAYSAAIGGTQTASSFTIASNAVLPASGIVGQAARYIPTLTLGAAYVVKIDAKLLSNTGTVVLTCRVNPTGPSGATAVSLFVQIPASSPAVTLRIGQEAIVNGGNSFTLPSGFFVIGQTYTLEIRVNGDFISGWINGVKYISRTTSSNNAFSGFAFGCENGSGNATFDNFFIYTGVGLSSYRQVNLIAVAGGSVYIGDANTQGALATGGAGAKANTGLDSLASLFGKAYIADGVTNLKVLDLTTKIVSDFTASAGTETAATLGQYQLAAVYRGRLVLAADRLNPQNFVLSRVGVPTDFNYAATDVATAFAGNASKAGQIGEPIVSLMPFNDDIMLIGGDHNLWAMRGDPADGGSIDLVSDAIGILGKDAWTKSPDGTIFFVGTGGLFKMSPDGGVPENISSGLWNEYFRSINRSTNYVQCAWDRDRHLMYVYVVPVNSGTALSLVWDDRTQAFWPIQLPTTQGPLCSLLYDGDGPTDRQILMGGRDGFIYRFQDTNTSDDGNAIVSYIFMGPAKADDATDSVIEELEMVMGGTSGSPNVVATLFAGQTVEEAYSAPIRSRIKTLTTTGRQSHWLPKLRGSSFFLKLGNATLNKTWTFEKAFGTITPSSIVRRKS